MSQPSTRLRRATLGFECLEDRTTPTFLTPNLTGPLTGQITFNGAPAIPGGLSIAAGDLLPDNALNINTISGTPVPRAENEYVLGTGPGIQSAVGIFSPRYELRAQFIPFPGYSGGINVAVGDVLGDGANEIVVAPATASIPVVAVFSPTGQLLSSFVAFSPLYTGGLNIAIGNVSDGVGAGGYHTRFTTFAGAGTGSGSGGAGIVGINLPDYKQEIIIGTASQSSRVLVTDGGGNVKRDFFAFDQLYTGGVTLAAGSVDKSRAPGYQFFQGLDDVNAYDEIIVGAASVAPAVRIYSAWEGGITLEQSYFAFPPTIRQGVTVAAGSSNGLRGAEIYTTLIGTSVIQVIDGITQEQLGFAVAQNAFPGAPQFSRVLNMAVADFDPAGGPAATAGYFPFDDETYQALVTNAILTAPPFFLEGGNPDFVDLDLAVVAGDGPYSQQPRYFTGAFLSSAPFNGP